MKRFAGLAVFVLLLNCTAFAQGSSIGKDNPNSGGAKLPVIRTITGTVKFHGDELTLVDDANGKPWNIINPDVVRSYEGQHVQITGHAFVEKHMIHAHTVEVVKATTAKK
ncbi:MAG TPA: hypothetical protein VG322_00010 [Candidatus Acidoferrales bacterium]|jgi:hypothetical protein|nr:hypothetical protein [Candidatus Acidoferrales bacterium]